MANACTKGQVPKNVRVVTSQQEEETDECLWTRVLTMTVTTENSQQNDLWIHPVTPMTQGQPDARLATRELTNNCRCCS